jgi:aspartyl-tRNA(Asn)/glutamyl-tRNA(Gln) amidotransferase subunit C
MTDNLTPEIFDHLVQLAALELNAEESKYLLAQLNYQMKSIHELEAIPLEENEPITTHGIPYTPEISPAARIDEWLPYPDTEQILNQAPEVEEGYVVVPEIPHQDLD